jgi:pimeloyl-ACP methyl ester carboxylesterase
MAMLESRLDAIAAPTAIVIGTADRIVPVHSAQRLAGQVPGARLIELTGATHLLPQQRPELLADLILEQYRAT